MDKLKYSAGMVSKGYWFNHFKKYMTLYNKGKSDKEIKVLQEEENILMSPSEDYGKKAINEVSKRAQALPENVKSMFSGLHLEDQKHLNTIGLMMTDRTFFEFMNEVYREDRIIGKMELEDKDIKVFFKKKSSESDKFAEYTDKTLVRLRGAIKTYLREAGLLEDKKGKSYYTNPLIDYKLEKTLVEEGLNTYNKILAGVR